MIFLGTLSVLNVKQPLHIQMRDLHRQTDIGTETETETETDTERERQTETRHRDRMTDRDGDRETERRRDRETETETDRRSVAPSIADWPHPVWNGGRPTMLIGKPLGPYLTPAGPHPHAY